MLKQTVSYTDFDEVAQEETLYFNLSKSQVADNLHLKEQLESLTGRLQGPERTLTTDEVREIIDMVKTFMRLSYGVRSDDGKRFYQTEENWADFKATAAYDAFLFSLFEEPTKAYSFMLGIMPKEIREEAEKAVNANANQPNIFEETLESTPAVEAPVAVPTAVTTDDDRPAWLVEGRAPSTDEFREATTEQKLLAFELKSQG